MPSLNVFNITHWTYERTEEDSNIYSLTLENGFIKLYSSDKNYFEVWIHFPDSSQEYDYIEGGLTYEKSLEVYAEYSR